MSRKVHPNSTPIALEISSRLLILVAVGTLTLTGELHPLLAAFSVLAILLSLLVLLPARSMPWPATLPEIGEGMGATGPHIKLWNTITVCILVVFIPDLLWLADSALHAAVHLLLYLMVYRLFHLDGPRAHLQLVLVAFLQILAATQYSSGLFFGFCFLLFLIMGVWTLMLIHLYQPHPSGNHPAERFITPSFFAMTTLMSVSAFFFTLAVFFVVPRVSTGLFSKKKPDPIKVAGFSERVDFGSMGPIKLESAVVMRVSVPDDDSRSLPLYLRGMAFDSYDGLHWSNRQTFRREIRPNAGGTFIVGPSSRHGIPVHQEVLLEPLGTPVLFGFSSLQAVGGEIVSVSVDPHDSAYLPFTPASRIQYRVDSRLSTVPTLELKAETLAYPDWIRDTYLQPTSNDQRIVDLAREVTQSTLTVYEKTKAVETHLRTSYRYSLDVKSTSGRAPIDDFLFGQKAGYCEHFATAMVLMVRSLGIPSRLVTGFLRGEWNEYGGYYIVRQRDAHAWVEVYFPKSGWITFDPTPPSLPQSTVWTTAISHYLDSLRIRWERYIINYSSLDQVIALSKAKDQTDSLWDSLQQGWAEALRMTRSTAKAISQAITGLPTSVWALLLALLVATGLLVLFVKRPRSRTLRLDSRTHSDKQSTQFYLLMLQILESKGMTKKQHLTPTEFLKSLFLSPQDLETIKEITHVYYRTRFGGKGMTLNERRKMEMLLATLIEAQPLNQ
jgi:transglutaminase-like putative cysteine protease